MILIIPVFLKVTFKVDIYRKLRLRNQPYASAGEPVIRELGLPAVLQLLLEDTVLIADRVAHSGEAGSCKAVQIAGSQSSEAAVAQACVGLILEDLIHIYSMLLEHSTDVVSQLKVIDACLEGASHEELH